MKTTVDIKNVWLSVKLFGAQENHIYLVKCADSYITTGVLDGETWWIYDHSKHENHPAGESYNVTDFCELPGLDDDWSSH